MIHDIVLYLLRYVQYSRIEIMAYMIEFVLPYRQGCYSQEGDIVVLCAYLGQLAKVRDALSDSVAVVIDERDQRELADREEEKEDDAVVEHVKVSKRVRPEPGRDYLKPHAKATSQVRLRTVDNYQGEEGRVRFKSLAARRYH